jgi:hypothetical protein
MNRFRRVSAEVLRLSPVEAEVWIVVEAEHITPTTEVRGRLVGPRCANTSTVEVAYPLRPFPRPPAGVPGLSQRVVIPDPSLWEPQRPFLYHVIVELWEDGARQDEAAFDYGLRMRGGATSPDTSRSP